MSWILLIICLVFVFACTPKMETSADSQPSQYQQYDYSTDYVPTVYNARRSNEATQGSERYNHAPKGSYGITRENFYYLNGG